MSDLLSGKTVLVVGLGLIGGSVARALRLAVADVKILAVGRDPQPLIAAGEEGTVDEWSTELSDLAKKADIVMIAVPTLSVAAVLEQLASLLRADAIITDASSVKGVIVEQARKILGSSVSRFVPGHPIAGSEKSGYFAARADLFMGRKVILTPTDETDSVALRTVARLWHATGADVHGMSVVRHDAVLAATSHLPHLLAYTLVNSLVDSSAGRGGAESGQAGGASGESAGQERLQQIFDYAAGGFAGFTRIASSDPVMWRDIFLSNADATVAVLDDYIADLQIMRKRVLERDGDAMQQAFTRARRTRNQFITRFNAGKSMSKQSSDGQEQAAILYNAGPGGTVSGDIRVPGDKSISHRSIMFGALAEGVTEISGFLEGEDALHTLQAFRDMGVIIVGPENGRVTVHGVGMQGLCAPQGPLYLGNSGTAMRLLCGLLAAQDFDSELHGDASLTQRPMNRVARPLAEMGAKIETAEGGRPPLRIAGAKLSAIDYLMPVASAQVKSCLLLAGLYADGVTSVTEPAPCRDHTERMLEGFGCELDRSNDGATVSLRGGQRLEAANIDVPSDISSAAFFMVAAAITPGADLMLRHVGVNPTRTGIINLLRAMGADIQTENEREVGGEPVADIRVRYSALKGITVPEDQIPLAIDEFPVLFVAAACAEGDTVLRGAEELRVKETDRIQFMADGLIRLGIDLETWDDGIRITGGQLQAGEVDSGGDHRIAMAFAVASLRSTGVVRILDCANVATSFPGFVSLARQVGFQLVQEEY